MALMAVGEVAELLGVKDVKVKRLEREILLLANKKTRKRENDNGISLFNSGYVEKHKQLAKRLGGI